MGIRLIVEVLDHAPADLGLAERMVLVAIAESANDATRQGWPGIETIAKRTGLSRPAVSKVLQRMARRVPPIEVRVSIGVGRDGRAVYAGKGHQTTYRIPPLRADHRPPYEDAKGGPPSALSTAKGGQRGAQRADAEAYKGGPPSAPSPQVPSVEPSSPRARTRAESLLADAGATDDEMKIILEKISSNGGVRNQGAYVAALIRNGDLAAMLAELRQSQSEEADRARRRRFMQSLEGKPPCVHGTAGGHIQEEGGWMLCALGRRNVAAGLSADGGVIS